MILAARTGFEPVTSALRGRCPKPLDERAMLLEAVSAPCSLCLGMLAGMEGVEPSLTEPESAVLPLDDIPVLASALAEDAELYMVTVNEDTVKYCFCRQEG